MKEFYFHEDFYCQIQLMPVSALTSGFGREWYLREDHSQHLRSLGISINSVAAVLDPILEPAEEVYTGYSTYRERCYNTRAWVLSCGTALLADFDETGVIQHFWIVNEPAEYIEQLKQALRALGELGDFFIADWNHDIAVPCNDNDKLRDYLSGAAFD